MLRTSNHGPLIISSNYWDLPESKLGKVLVSCNAGAFRLLIPETAEPYLDDMRTAKGCAVTRGPWPAQGLADAFEVLFDDATTDPFALHLSPQSFDRLPTEADTLGEWVLSCWTRPRRGRPHKAMERPCRYRIAAKIPDLRPWQES
jgi:hypothetical protein